VVPRGDERRAVRTMDISFVLWGGRVEEGVGGTSDSLSRVGGY
jgi:hypothetical protein